MFSKYLGKAILSCRNHRQMTQIDLAEALSIELKAKISQSYISKVETGTGPSWQRFQAICKILNYKMSDVVQIAEGMQGV